MTSVDIWNSSESCGMGVGSYGNVNLLRDQGLQSQSYVRQDGLEVTENGKALKVQTDKPHLVSLGSGRYSTSVTLHPLQSGTTTIGTSDASVPQDIVITGTGVEKEHCYIDNSSGTVVLYPIAKQISIDGIPVSAPTQLAQGCMLCFGRSNYFRFNHPQEAQLMKSIFPNSRISIVPMSFNQEYTKSQPQQYVPSFPVYPPGGALSSLDAQQRRSSGGERFRDELESEDFVEKVSKFEYSARSKPNPSPPSHPNWWFVRDGLRSSSSPQQQQHHVSTLPRASSSSSSSCCSHPGRSSSSSSGGPPSRPSSARSGAKPATPVSTSSSPCPSAGSGGGSSTLPRHVSSDPSYRGSGGRLCCDGLPPPVPPKKPSSPPGKHLNSRVDQHLSPKVFLPMALTPPEKQPLPHLPGRCTPTYHRQNGLGSHCSLEDLHKCEQELEKKHLKVIEERIKEQQMEKQEQQRLEEILSMCAEYERQSQLEKKKGSGPTFSMVTRDKRERPDSEVSGGADSPIPSPSYFGHMSRIKTNGSLPRDRTLGSTIPSPHDNLSPTAGQPPKPFKSSSSEDELEHIFQFHSLPSPSGSCSRNAVVGGGGGANVGGRTTLTTEETTSGHSTYPPSPRTLIKTVAAAGTSTSAPPTSVRNVPSTTLGGGGAWPEIFENQLALAISDDQLACFEKGAGYRGSGGSSRNSGPISPPFKCPTATSNPEHQNHRDGCNSARNSSSSSKTDSTASRHPSLGSPSSGVNNKGQSTASVATLSSQRPSAGQDSGVQDPFGERGIETLKATRSALIQKQSDLKFKILELESQEEELLHEMDLECALLDGETQAQKTYLSQAQQKIESLKQQEKYLAEVSERDRANEHYNIMAARARVDSFEKELVELETRVKLSSEQGMDVTQLLDKIRQLQEILENERKNFEDLEFQLLEHDAHREEEKELILQELKRTADECLLIEETLADVGKQKRELVTQVKADTGTAEVRRQMLLLQFKQDKDRLQELETKLNADVVWRKKGPRQPSPDASPRSSDGDLINTSLEEKIRQLCVMGRSSEPKELISRMTSSVPLLPKDARVGGRTSATMQEIEKSRQKMLEVQGVIVIEQERRRLEELKKRAANEVCLQWQERMQREATSSLPSSESERSSGASSSDVPTQSDDAAGKLTDSDRNSSSISTGKESDDADKVQQREEKLSADDLRPLSTATSREDWLDVKLREKQRLERPLTRYLPVRSDNFDLKQHIETAGHQIENCPHVQLTPTSCRGYLHKMGCKFKTWNKRWFVFDRIKRTFVYFADKHEHKPRGGVYFQAIEEVFVDHLHSVKSPNPQVTFCVKTLDRTFFLMAPNAEVMRIWVDVIFTGAEGYTEFQLDM